MTKKSLEKNIKVFPLYRAFSYDFLFLWTISIMYLTWKGLSYSQTIFLDSVFMLSAFILQIPIAKLIKKIGSVRCIKIAGFCFVGFACIYIFCNTFIMFALANVLYGLYASIKNVGDAQMLSFTLKKLDRQNEFSKIEGKGTSLHYVFESVAAIASGYMFQYISPYAPIIATLICTVILIILSCMLVDPKDGEVLEEVIIEKKQTQLEHNKDIITVDAGKLRKNKSKALKSNSYDNVETANQVSDKNIVDGMVAEIPVNTKSKKGVSYKKLLADKFILSMIVFCFCYYGIMSVYSTLAKVYYQDIGVKAWMFGYIFFAFKMVTAICSKFQFKYELKRGVRSLIIFAILTILSFGLNGLMATINATSVISIIVISGMFLIQNAIRSPYRIFVKNYINISSEKENLSQVLTLYSMSEYLGFSFITLIVSIIMEFTNNSFSATNLIITAIIALPMMIAIIIFIKELIKKYTKKQTIIRADMKDDL